MLGAGSAPEWNTPRKNFDKFLDNRKLSCRTSFLGAGYNQEKDF
jgi:hypothetical protein